MPPHVHVGFYLHQRLKCAKIFINRVKLSDGRHLAYKERGIAKEVAKHNIIVSHGVGVGDSKGFHLQIFEV